MGRGTGDGAAPFLCVVGRAERTASHAVQPRFPWCVISHAGLMLPSSPCLAAVFSLPGRCLLLIYNTRARDSAIGCLLSVREMARRRHFVPRGLSLGRQGGSQLLPAGFVNALLFENQSFPKSMAGILEAFMVALGESYSRVSEGMQIRSYKGGMEMEVWTNVNKNGRFVHFLGSC